MSLWAELVEHGSFLGTHRADVVERSFCPKHQLLWHLCGSTGHLGGRGQQLVVGHATMGKADSLCLGTIDDFAEENGGSRGLRATDVLEHPGVAATGMDTDLQKTIVEAGRLAGQPHITDERQIHPRPDSSAIDSGDGRQRAAPDPEKAFVDGQETFLFAVAEMGEVRTRTEGGTGASDDERLHFRVGFDLVEGGLDLATHVEGHGVPTIGIVEGEGGYWSVDGGGDQWHGRSVTDRSVALNPKANGVCGASGPHGPMVSYPLPMPETAFIQRPRLVLASASPRRKALLASVGVDVDVEPADIDETPRPDEQPDALVRRLSATKADAVSVAKNDLVIAADTIVVVEDQILGKPVDEDDARSMLELLSGRTHRVLTGVSIRGGDRTETEVETAEVTMRFLSVADIAWYIGTGEPMGKAGAYAIQGFGSLFVPEIVGNHSGIVGLPLPLVDALLARFGRPLPTWLPRG